MTTRYSWPVRGHVDVWAVPVDQETSAAAVARAEGMLSATEQARAGELVRTADRELYLVAHVALRELLGRYTGVPPDELDLPPEGSIQGARHGGPVLQNRPCLRFSLSHSAGLAVIAVATDPVGIDTESCDAGGGDIDALTAYLHPDEQRAIAAHPPSRRRRAFLHCWVRKEAYLKGRGIGLSEELSLSNVSVGADGQPRELLSGWRLLTVPAAETHLTAVAVLLPPDHPQPRVQTRAHLVHETPRRQQASSAAVSTVRCSDEVHATGSGPLQGARSSSMRPTASPGVRTCDARSWRPSRERPDSPRHRATVRPSVGLG